MFIIKYNKVMSRTKGSKNLPKDNGLYTLKFEKQIENTPVSRNSNRGWVNYGIKNLYPFDLLNLYAQSVTHRACCDFAVNSIVGNGVDYDAMKAKNVDIITPNYYEDWNTFLRKISLDFIIYGSFAFQIIKNKDGKTYSIYHQPYETVRLSPFDEDGVITSAWICDDWSSVGKYPPKELPMFGFQEDETIQRGQPYLYVYRAYTPQNVYYSAPVYSSALNAIQAEIEFQRYDLKAITNNFVPSGMLELAPVESERDKQDIIDNINRMFVGSDAVNSLMITFGNGTEESPVKFTPFTTNSANVNLYEASNERTINRIMTAHRISSKALIGLPMDSTGFSNEGSLLETAYALYNITVGNHNRQIILNTINNVFKLNGVDVELILKPLSFTTTVAQSNDNSDDVDRADDNELEEMDTTINKENKE